MNNTIKSYQNQISTVKAKEKKFQIASQLHDDIQILSETE